jgi:hypothetical protein
VILYAESSAVLAWILGEAAGEPVRHALAEAELVLASDVTLIECDRVLVRAVATSLMSEADAANRKARLAKAAAHWVTLTLDQAIVDRARRPFPGEPVSTAHAMHLATLLEAQSVVREVTLLSLDHRLRHNALELGFEVVPEAT